MTLFPCFHFKQKPQTPKAAAKKVTFGLKNNKTAGKTGGDLMEHSGHIALQ